MLSLFLIFLCRTRSSWPASPKILSPAGKTKVSFHLGYHRLDWMGHTRNRFSPGKKIALRPRPIPHSKTIDVFNDHSYLLLNLSKDFTREFDISDFEHLLDCDRREVLQTWPLLVAEQITCCWLLTRDHPYWLGNSSSTLPPTWSTTTSWTSWNCSPRKP